MIVIIKFLIISVNVLHLPNRCRIERWNTTWEVKLVFDSLAILTISYKFKNFYVQVDSALCLYDF
jgi:hypothetical protein